MTDRPDDATPRLTEEEAAQIAAYVDGRLSPSARCELEQQVVGDDRLAAGLYAEMNLRRVVAAAAGAEVPVPAPAADATPMEPEGPRVAPLRRRRPAWLRPRLWVPAAAALALLIVLPRLLSSPSQRPPVLRGGDRPPVGLTPVGDLTTPPITFTWTPDPLAERYRFRLYDGAARLLYECTTRDERATLPEGAVAWPGIGGGYWVVTPLAGDGAERPSSEPVRFRIVVPQ